MAKLDPGVEAMLRLRGNLKEATGLIVLLGYDVMHFVEAIGDEQNVELLRDVLVLLPLQNMETIKDGREINDIAQRLVQGRIDKIEEDRAELREK